MAKKALTVNVRIEGARETIAAFNRLPKEASDALRDRSLELAEALAAKASGYARQDSKQSALMAATVKARRDRVPVVVAGGAKRVGRNRVPAYAILFGSEFGSSRLRQYRHHLGRGSYWFFATVEKEQAEISAAWNKAADEIIDKFGGA